MPETEGNSNETATRALDGEPPIVEPDPGLGVQSREVHLSFVVNEHVYLGEALRFADQKAGLTLALALGALTLGHNLGLYSGLLLGQLPPLGIALLVLPGLLLLLAAAGLSASAIAPRLDSGTDSGLVYWKHVRRLGDPAKYAAAVKRCSDDQLVAELSCHCYVLAGIVDRKFSLTSKAIAAALIGGALTLAAAAQAKLPSPAPDSTKSSSHCPKSDRRHPDKEFPHGARNLDTVPAAAHILPRVDGRLPILGDGGIRRGTDVLKALALGATAVLLGRPYRSALAAGGADGVASMVNILRRELQMAMALSGRVSIAGIDRSVLF